MSDWQPIETAPTDGTRFLGWDGSNMEIVFEGWRDEGKPVFCNAEYISQEPTHWMPLPEGPK